MTLSPRLLWRNLDRHFLQFAGSAKEKLVVIAPFIKERIFQLLLDAVKSDVKVQVYTRWLPSEVALGVSDPQILTIAQKTGRTSVHLIDELHAKLVIADADTALIGSANLTSAAWGTSRVPNFETATILSPIPQDLTLFLLDLGSRSRIASDAEMYRVLSEADKLKRVFDFTKFESESQADSTEEFKIKRLPRSRSPDRLYRQYVSLHDNVTPDLDAAHDFLMIDFEPSLNEEEFNHAARTFLKSHPIVSALDKFLSKPRRFGEVWAWLRDLYSKGDDAETAKKYTQTLMRWLLYFESERYRLETANYSEILSLKSE